MGTIYVTGHQNPDLDSVASAYVCAYLKNQIDPDNSFVPVRCGNLNPQTRRVFERLGITPPELKKDVFTRVRDVMDRRVVRLNVDQPLQEAITAIDEASRSIVPVFNDDGKFAGTIGSTEISQFLIRETFGTRPHYRFSVKNFGRLMPGRLLQPGNSNEFSAPIMIGAMPLERSIERIQALEDSVPLLIVGPRKAMIEHAVKVEFPAIILTGANEEDLKQMDFSSFKGAVYLSDVDTAETVRLLRYSTPLGEAMETEPQVLDANERFESAKRKLTASGRRGLAVFDRGEFVGIVSRASFLDRPRQQLVLVDHNEVDQSIPGARDADIVEIIDHHRVGSVMSRQAFSLYTRPVGCTCTILHQLYRQHGVALPQQITKLILSAILSDTLQLKSPTTTEEDRTAVHSLARHAGVDWEEWGQEMFNTGERLHQMNAEEAVEADFKEYDVQGVGFGIGQVEVHTLVDLDAALPALTAALEKLRGKRGLSGALLLVTDVIQVDSALIASGLPHAARVLPYDQMSEGVFSLPGVVSRKKQLLPEVLRAVEETLGAWR